MRNRARVSKLFEMFLKCNSICELNLKGLFRRGNINSPFVKLDSLHVPQHYSPRTHPRVGDRAPLVTMFIYWPSIVRECHWGIAISQCAGSYMMSSQGKTPKRVVKLGRTYTFLLYLFSSFLRSSIETNRLSSDFTKAVYTTVKSLNVTSKPKKDFSPWHKMDFIIVE